MADAKYIIPENPAYQAEDIRKLQDNDPASATNTFNPLVQKILESIAHNKKHKAELDATGKVLKDQLPEMNFADLNDKGMPGGFASLDDTGKVPWTMCQIPKREAPAASQFWTEPARFQRSSCLYRAA